MNPEQLYDGITQIRDDLVEEPVSPRKPEPKPKWGRWFLSAAAILAVIFLGSLVMGGTAGSGGGNGGRTYMSYHGPVFPLDVLEDTELTATRLTDYDFSPMNGEIDHSYVDQYGETVHYQYGGYEVIVTDSYTLTNDTDRDVTVTAVYPFGASLDDNLRVLPRITVDGTGMETDLRLGAEIDQQFDQSWTAYQTLLQDGSYQNTALGESLTADQPVIVYELTDFQVSGEASAPLLRVTVDLPKGSVLMSYGSSGGFFDPENGGIIRTFHVKGADSKYLLVFGGDLSTYHLQGYPNAGCVEGEEIEITCRVERYATTVYQMLERFYSKRNVESSEEIRDQAAAKLALGLLSAKLERYGTAVGDLSELFSLNENAKRVMYLTFPITVPAHGQTEISIAMHKQAHTDYTGRGAQRQGYDLVTGLGSSLTFTGQRASISNFENFAIMRQNFGFDPKHGVTTVILDPNVEYYWMDVRKRR